jgi:exonuclease III
MDGGTESRAFSEEAVNSNLLGVQKTYISMSQLYAKNGFDFVCYQEVDFDSTRSYHVDIKERLKSFHLDYASTFAQNYDSPYIMIPLKSPHGANNSGLLTLSKHRIQTAERVELPLEASLAKYVDLDRCLSINRFLVDNEKELVLINLHLSGYSSDGAINATQLKILVDICKAEYEKGNYVICAGDFNMDLVDGEGSAGLFGGEYTDESWAQPIDPSIFEGTGIAKHAPVDKANPVPTCRNAIRPYSEGNSVSIIDGFLASQNVLVMKKTVYDTGFKYSDHNPVVLTFQLAR